MCLVQVLASVGEVPGASYKMFVEMLSGTVRDSIAESCEAAYESLALAEGLRMLRMTSVQELQDYTAMREREWDIDVANKVIRFKEENKEDLEV